MGYLELSANDFWDMQYNELMMRHHAYSDKLESSFKRDYELARWQCWMILQPHLDSKKGDIKSPNDLIAFAWEEGNNTEVEKPSLSIEEINAIASKMDKAVFTTGKDSFDELVDIGKKQKILKNMNNG